MATKTVTADMCVTKAKPAAAQMADLNFGWHIVKHVKSNAIVAVRDGRTLGVGAGQMNRIGSAELALRQAHADGVTEGLVLASDGFFTVSYTHLFDSTIGRSTVLMTFGGRTQGRETQV